MAAPPSDLAQYAKELLEASVIGGDSGKLHNSLTDDFKQILTIAELSRRLAEMEKRGEFTRIGNASEMVPNPDAPGFWAFDVEVFAGDVQWFAHFSMNSDHKLNEFSFWGKATYMAPEYLQLEKIESRNLSELPVIRFIMPNQRKTRKLPVAVFLHAVVHLRYDGQMGVRYPFSDLDFLAQHKVGLIRNSYENYERPDPVIAIARQSLDLGSALAENGGLFLVIHSFAALFLPDFLALGHEIRGVILINPAWEAAPESGLPNMSTDKINTDIPMLIIGSGNDQLLTDLHFQKWKESNPSADSEWFDYLDHFLMDSVGIPDEMCYMKSEGHVNVTALRRIVKWVREHWSDPD
jgi:pimeloyl-ACP methyl ester carboxylesterase